MDIGQRVKELRTDLKLDQNRFSKRIQSSQSYLSGVESGNINPSKKVIELICNEFKVKRTWLVEGLGQQYQEEFTAWSTLDSPKDLIGNGIWDFNKIMNELEMKADKEEFNNILGMIYKLYLTIRKK